MYDILFSNQFKRSYKKCLKRGYDKALFEEVITLLAETGTLPLNINHINCLANGKACGNAIFSLIGCLFGSSAIWNLYLF